MAGQDLKNYTRIWNPILEAMAKARFTSNQYKICLALFQNTYAWHKTEARIGYRDFERETGIKAKKISQPFRQLVNLNVIIEVEQPSFNAPGLYKFNKNITKWSSEVLNINQISEKNLTIVTEECGATVPVKGTPPQDGDSHQNEGERSPQNGGEGSPQNGDTKQLSSAWDSSDSGSLKKGLKKYKEINDDNNDTRAGTDLHHAFEKEFGRPLGPMEINQIQIWGKDMDPQLILEALRKAVLRGKYNFSYIDSILLNWQKNNIRTLLDVRRQDEEFEASKSKGNNKTRAPNKRDGPQKEKDDQKEFYKTLYMG